MAKPSRAFSGRIGVRPAGLMILTSSGRLNRSIIRIGPEITCHSYSVRWGEADKDPSYADLDRLVSAAQSISTPGGHLEILRSLRGKSGRCTRTKMIPKAVYLVEARACSAPSAVRSANSY
jgi:hypothetical protein